MNEEAAPLITYFAYGSNLDGAQMEKRCRHPQRLAPARLEEHRFVINSRGYATVTPESGGVVHGLLWSLSESDVLELDHYEGVTRDLYRRATLPVVLESGRLLDALVYVATDSSPGPPQTGYLERIVAAALDAGLPAAYIEELRAWGRRP